MHCYFSPIISYDWNKMNWNSYLNSQMNDETQWITSVLTHDPLQAPISVQCKVWKHEISCLRCHFCRGAIGSHTVLQSEKAWVVLSLALSYVAFYLTFSPFSSVHEGTKKATNFSSPAPSFSCAHWSKRGWHTPICLRYSATPQSKHYLSEKICRES